MVPAEVTSRAVGIVSAIKNTPEVATNVSDLYKSKSAALFIFEIDVAAWQKLNVKI
ncbi:hypothetical protein D3C81_1840490 [compost metagenome]